ncbi:Uricase [Haloferax sp. BAB-2207]|nr:2-oxo-4-hydroxy-4-carboxy-5-ureidoimidazoline decarboxylase [Haloferax sp. BAB-2207]ELK54920.1 Uricase [Haloferax sp. BAB-2207]
MHELTLQQVNRLDDDSFVDALGEIYEHSPWVAERARSSRPFSSVDELRSAMKRAVEDASREKQLQLLQAHPDLGERTEMTDASEAEQASAGLDSLSRSQYETFQRLNETYRERFGFPFVMAVKDENPDAIAAAMERRVDHSESTEFRTALDEVHTIAELRLAERFSSE